MSHCDTRQIVFYLHVSAQVAYALAFSILSGKLLHTPYKSQKFMRDAQAELCFFHVLLVTELRISFSRLLHRLSVSLESSFLLDRNLSTTALLFTLNLSPLSSPSGTSEGSGPRDGFFLGILNLVPSSLPPRVKVSVFYST